MHDKMSNLLDRENAMSISIAKFCIRYHRQRIGLQDTDRLSYYNATDIIPFLDDMVLHILIASEDSRFSFDGNWQQKTHAIKIVRSSSKDSGIL